MEWRITLRRKRIGRNGCNKAPVCGSQHGFGHEVDQAPGVLLSLGAADGGRALLGAMREDVYQTDEVHFSSRGICSDKIGE